MPRPRHTAEEMLAKLHEVDALTGCGLTLAEAARGAGVTVSKYLRWRKLLGGPSVDKSARLRALDDENARLRKAAPRSVRVPALCIRDTGTAKGRGVFALRRFSRGDLVEVAPVLVLKVEYEDLPELLKTYVFDWTTLAGLPRGQAVALGYGSLYNHGSPANLRYLADVRDGVMRYVAARDIERGEELTINYNARGGSHEWIDDNWFERADVAVIQDA